MCKLTSLSPDESILEVPHYNACCKSSRSSNALNLLGKRGPEYLPEDISFKGIGHICGCLGKIPSFAPTYDIAADKSQEQHPNPLASVVTLEERNGRKISSYK
jgi:hypothetical protein